MILTPEKQEAIVRAAMADVHANLGDRSQSSSVDLRERAIAYATIKHTLDATASPEGKEGSA